MKDVQMQHEGLLILSRVELSFKACLSRVGGNGLKWPADIKLSHVGQTVCLFLKGMENQKSF